MNDQTLTFEDPEHFTCTISIKELAQRQITADCLYYGNPLLNALCRSLLQKAAQRSQYDWVNEPVQIEMTPLGDPSKEDSELLLDFQFSELHHIADLRYVMPSPAIYMSSPLSPKAPGEDPAEEEDEESREKAAMPHSMPGLSPSLAQARTGALRMIVSSPDLSTLAAFAGYFKKDYPARLYQTPGKRYYLFLSAQKEEEKDFRQATQRALYRLADTRDDIIVHDPKIAGKFLPQTRLLVNDGALEALRRLEGRS